MKVGTIEDGDTLTFYENDLYVILSEARSRHYIIFTVGSPGYPSQSIRGASVGDSFYYQGKSSFQVVITSYSQIGLTNSSVDFTVINLEDGKVHITPTPDDEP